MKRGSLLICLLMVIASGCAPISATVAPETLHVSHKSHYKALSECLFSSLAADREEVDYSLFTCSGRAVLSQRGEPLVDFVKITSIPEGSMVDVSADSEQINKIALYVERCAKQINLSK